jgi:hypothetical protein
VYCACFQAVAKAKLPCRVQHRRLGFQSKFDSKFFGCKESAVNAIVEGYRRDDVDKVVRGGWLRRREKARLLLR